MHHLHGGRLLDVQQRIISLIALGGQWAECLDLIATEIERLIPREDAYCSILFLDGDRARSDPMSQIRHVFEINAFARSDIAVLSSVPNSLFFNNCLRVG